jgi:hypothetical protein
VLGIGPLVVTFLELQEEAGNFPSFQWTGVGEHGTLFQVLTVPSLWVGEEMFPNPTRRGDDEDWGHM